MQELMVTWLEKKRRQWLLDYVRLAEEGERFPNYARLGAMDRRALFQREVDGLIAFLRSDLAQLERIQQTHESQATRITDSIPLDEQLEFLDLRIDWIRRQIETEEETAPFRGRVAALLDRSASFYKSKLRTFEVDG